ncbi:MAG: ATP-binding cassette domain-containing protein [Spirochaetaceae bacterium]|jgi:energy-coupling factor transport system ATP-binding protein|nr:ATP-binding cassette domain-containing protein [Spirochaetaceae bacterium]
MAGVRIAVQNLSFSYTAGSTYTADGGLPHSPERALSGVSFAVREGEFVSILGPNGSGKSTLLSCINGLCAPPAGAVTVYDRDGRAFDPADDGQLDMIRRITGTVLQNPDNQIVAPIVEEDCAFGPENLRYPPDVVAERVSAALRQTGIEALRGRATQFLSGGEKQRLAAAGALAMGSDILLLDECTAMIDPAGRDYFYALIDKLVREGRTVIQITHSAEDAARSSRCIILEKGVITYDGKYRPVAPPEIKPLPGANAAGSRRPVCVSFDRVFHTYLPGTVHERPALTDVSLVIGQNESLAIVGATGSGKSTVLKHINALLLPTTGKVAVFGEDTLDKKTSLAGLRRRVCLAPQSPETALFETHVADDVAYGARNLGLKGKPLVDRVRETMDAVGLPFAAFADRETSSLSGGEARLAALAGVFVLDSDIILLDEPTAGLDDEHSAQIIRLLGELKLRGKTIVVSTHSLAFAAYFDRVLMMAQGSPVTTPALSPLEYPVPEHSAPEYATPKPPDKARRRKTGLEFFSGATPGAVSSPDSPLKQLPAGTKLAAAVLCVVAAAVIPGPAFSACLFAAALALGRIGGKIPPVRLIRGFLPILPVLAVFIVIRLLFSWYGDTSPVLLRLGIVTVTAQELRETAVMLVRLFTILTLITLYSSVTPLRETVNAVKKLLAALSPPRNGKPENRPALARDIGLVIDIALRFVPLISAEAEQIAASQISRGAKTRGLARLAALKAMIVPLFLRSLERSQTLAKAMLLRLYR